MTPVLGIDISSCGEKKKLLQDSEHSTESSSTITLLKARVRNDFVHTREALSAFWPRFSLFSSFLAEFVV